jgi:hypothetical protein
LCGILGGAFFCDHGLERTLGWRPEGERPYAHWVGGAPRFRIEVTHHADWVESYNTASNVHLRFACFER